MKKKTINLFILLIILGQSLYSQDKYDPGYVVTTKKDTINGFIMNKIDYELAYKISFKRNLLDKTIIEYAPSELLGFRFNSGRAFERKRITNNKLAANTKDSLYIFAKNIIKGKIDLFVWRHKNNNSKDFFIINNSSKRQAQLFKSKPSIVKVEGKTYSKKNNRYKNLITYVKSDESLKPDKKNNLRFDEKSIRKDITSFNRNFQDEYPLEIYEEPYENNYDFLVGIPFRLKQDELHFRIGIYRNKTFIEKSNKVSFINGVIYHHWSDNDKEWNSEYKNGTSNYSWQMLNIIPIGIKYQSNSKHIIPYVFLGVGAVALLMKDHIIEDYEVVGNQNKFIFFPTVNIGLGTKIKLNSNYIITEITPTFNGVFFNVGYSF